MVKEILHSSFRLNGNRFNNTSELLQYAENYLPEVSSFLKAWFDNSEELKVQTSGSTGDPKIIFLKKSAMLQSAFATGEFFSLKAGTTALLCMSVGYIAGKMMLVRALYLGWDMDVVKVQSNPLKLTEKKYDFAAMIPLQVHHCFENLYRIGQLIIGGGVVPETLLKKIKTLPIKVFSTYGMTETITHIAAKRLNGLEDRYYKTLPNIKLSLDRRDCLQIHAPLLSERVIVTNDVVHLLDDHTFEWLGRYDSVINSGGIKLIPEQLELKLSGLISERFFIASEPDDLLGNKVVLVIESKKKLVEEVASDVLIEIKTSKRLSKFEIPKKVYVIPQFIETPTGKINRKSTLLLL